MKLKEIKTKIEEIKKDNANFSDEHADAISLLQTDILYEILRVLKRIEDTVDNIDHYLP